MAAIVVASNILVQFLVGDWLTWGAFTYPFAFLVTDLMNRLHGPAAARKVVVAGFVVGLVCSFVGAQIEGPFGPLVSLRVAIGSGTAFLVGQLSTSRSSTGCGRGAGGGRRWSRACSAAWSTRRSSSRSPSRRRWRSSRRRSTWPGRTRRCRCSGAGRWRRSGCRSRLPIFAVKLAIAVFALAPFRAALGLAQARGARLATCLLGADCHHSGHPKPAKGGDPMSSETLEREAGFSRGVTA